MHRSGPRMNMASFAWKAAARSPSESDSIKRVMPQPGQSSPVMAWKGHGRLSPVVRQKMR